MKLALRRLLIFLIVLTMVIPAGLAYAATDDGTASQEEAVSETPLEGGEGDVAEIDPATLNVHRLGEDLDLDAIKAKASKDVTTGYIDPDMIAGMDESELNKTVRVSIFLDDPAVLDKYKIGDTGKFTARSYRSRLESNQASVEKKISSAIGRTIEVKWHLTLAVNAISTEATYAEIAQIYKVRGVRRVELERRYDALEGEASAEPNTSITSEGMTGAAQTWAQGYTGAGTRIAIIDTGIDLTHQSFDAAAFDHAISELTAKGKTVELMTEADIPEDLNGEGVYYSSKLPYIYNYVDGNTDVTHVNDTEGEHGSHVAGIAAANRYVNIDGEFVDAGENVYAVGMAPDAQVIVMKVFGKKGGAYDSDYMAAIEDAIMLGCDSCNLSLGSGSPGFTYDNTYQEVLNNLSDDNEGMVVSISAGNAYGWGDHNSYLGELFSEDINMDTVGSPGSFINSFSVASAENIGITGKPLVFNGTKKSYYTESSNSGGKMSDISNENGYDYVYIYSLGSAEDYAAVNAVIPLEGKIVIVNRGSLSFVEKGNNLIDYKPAGLVIANNQGGTISMALDGYTGTFPMVSITQDDAFDVIYSSTGSQKVGNINCFTGKVMVQKDVSADVTGETENTEISDFSSWGVPGSLIMKPEITAPGGNIYSVAGTNTTTSGGTAGGPDQYELMSGTSMAAPHIAGLSAILLQYLNENDLSAFNKELTDNYTPRAIAQSLLMSTAVPMQPHGYLPVLRQGAGLADVSKAVNAKSAVMIDDAYLTSLLGSDKDGKVKVELGDDPEKTGQYSYKFTIYNTSDVDEEFELDTDMFTQALDETYSSYDIELMSPSTTDIAANVSYSWNSDFKAEMHDVDKDGDTDEDDAQSILDYITGEAAEDELDLKAADMDGDEAVTSKDAQLLLEFTPEGYKSNYIVPANGKAEVTVYIDITEDLSNYPSGAYIEGYTYANCITDTKEGVSFEHSHSIPILGFYGSWTDASMFDKFSYYDGLEISELMGDDPDEYTDLYTYTGNWMTNFMTIKSDGQVLPFIGNPYKVEEEGFPYDRLAISSDTEITDFYYNLIRPAGTLGYAVSSLDKDNNITEVLDASVTGYQDTGAWFYENEGTQRNTQTRAASVNKAVKTYGVEEGQKFRVGFYAVPEYYAIMLNDLVDLGTREWYSGMLYEYSDVLFPALIENQFMGSGSYIGYDLTVDDTPPVLENAAFNEEDGTVSVKAKDNQNIAYLAVMDVNGDVVYDETVPASPEEEIVFDISEYVESVEGYVAVFAGDYAGNETAVSLKVNDTEAPDPTLVSGVTLDPGTVNLFTGESSNINVKVSPLTAVDKTVKWSSLDETVATVSETGTVTGVKAGTTLIRATSVSDETKFAECKVVVLSVDKDLSNIVWDEDGKIWFSDFNTLTLPKYEKKAESEVPSLMTAFNYYGSLVAGSLDTESAKTVLYMVDPEDKYSTIQAGDENYMWASDITIGMYDAGLPLAYTYGSNIVLGNLEAEDYDGTKYTGLPYGAGSFPDTVGEGVYLAGIAFKEDIKKVLDQDLIDYYKALYEYYYGENAEAYYAEDYPEDSYYAPSYYFLDEKGNIWYTEVYLGYDEENQRDSILFTEPELVIATGIATNFIYQSLYYDGEYLYWSHYDDGDFANLYVIELDKDENTGVETGTLYTAGNFGASVWPASGLYEKDAVAGQVLSDNGNEKDIASDGNRVSVATKAAVMISDEEKEATDRRFLEEAKKLRAKDSQEEAAAEEPVEETAEQTAEAAEEPAAATVTEPAEEVTEAEAAEEPLTEEAAEAAESETQDEAEEEPAGSLNAVSRTKAEQKNEITEADVLGDTGTDTPGTAEEAVKPEYGVAAVDIVEKADSANGLMILKYDPEVYKLVDAGSDLEHYSIHVDDEKGTIKFAYADSVSITAGEVLASVLFDVPCDANKITIDTIERNGELGLEEEKAVDIEGSHDWGEPSYEWAEDMTTVKATIVCGVDPTHVETETAAVTKAETAPTCEAAGYTTYTAEFKNELFETQTERVDGEPALGHDWGAPVWTWSDDLCAATATFTCGNNAEHVETVEADMDIASEGTEGTFTAAVTGPDGKAYTDVKTGPVNGFKFRARVSSVATDGTKGSVTGTVFNDYNAELIFSGDNVNRSNAALDMWMINVGSLGVDGTRYYNRALKTGLPDIDTPMTNVKSFFNGLNGKETTIIGQIEDKSTEYTVTREENGNIYAVTDEEAAREVWHAIVNEDNMTATTGKDDSYITIANGSYFQIGSQILEFENKDGDDLKLDNFNNLGAVDTSIRDAVVLGTAEEAIENAVIYLEPGTTLSVGESQVTLERDAKITIDIDGVDEEETLGEILPSLRDSDSISKLITNMLGGMSQLLTAMGGETTTVTFEFGHDWTINYEWAEDLSSVTATADCGNNPAHAITETVETVDEEVAPTCEEAGYTSYTATFENEVFEEQTEYVEGDPATGHKWGKPEWYWGYYDLYGVAVAFFTCENDEEHQESVTTSNVLEKVKEATCEEEGKATYFATVRFDGRIYSNTYEEVIPATGHDWSEVTYTWSDDNTKVTATRTCNNDPAHVETETADATYAVTTEATCKAAGTGTWTSAAFKNEAFSVQTKTVEIPVKEHTIVTDAAKAPTCTETGLTEGSHCSVCNEVFKAQETVPATGHSWGDVTYVWAEDNSEVTATRTCKNDAKHVETETAKTTKEVKEPTYDEAGYTRYTVSFDNEAFAPQTKETEIPKLAAEVVRIFGSTRYETSLKAADELKLRLGTDKFDTVILACGSNYADALAGSYLSCLRSAPILLVDGRADHISAVQAYIKDNLKSGGTIYMLGGTAVVPDSAVAGLTGYQVKRLWGTDRYATNVAILKEAGLKGDEILVASGTGFADSLSAAAVGKPILLVKGALTNEQKDYLKDVKGSTFTIIGGSGAVSDALMNEVKAYGAAERVWGQNRYETSVEVAKKYFDGAKVGVLAYGANFPDGLCGGVLANTIGGPLVLTGNGKTDEAVKYAGETGMKSGMVLGGPTLISDDSAKAIFHLGADAEIIVR